MILGSIFFVNSYAFTNGNSEKTLGENIYPYGQGILKFQETDTGPCHYNIPNFDVKTVNPSKDSLLNLDDVENNFFVVLGNVNDESFKYLQIELPTGEGNPAYLLDFKKGDQRLRGEFYVGYKNLAVVVESDGKETPLADESYEKYFEGNSKDITYNTHTFGSGRYDFGAILLKSDSSSWINNDKCVIRIDYPFTITNEGKIISSEPITKIGLLSDITSKFSPLQQHKSGVNPDSTECKPGLHMILQQIDEYGDKRPACVTPNTAEKLIQRGWLDGS